MKSDIHISGHGVLLCHNADGTFAWKRWFRNAPTTAGLTYLAGSAFDSTIAKLNNWYALLVSSTGFTTGFAVGDTMLSHAGWAEFTGYSGNRPTWVNSTFGGLCSSNGPFTFPVTANGIVHGIGIVSDNTKGGTAGTLWCTALLSADAVATIGQNITGLYSANMVGG